MLKHLALLYVIHELGHVIMYLAYGIPFKILIFPELLGIPHIIGFERAWTGDFWKELMIKLAGPLILKTIYVLFNNDKRLVLAYGFSYGDIIRFIQQWVI